MSTRTAETAGNQPNTPTIHVVLVPGFWLGAWAWDDVVPALERAGLTPHPVTLPGLEPDEDRTGLTLEDQVQAVLELVDGLEGDVVLVGHSGGAPVVQSVADRRTERIARVVYIDSGPMNDGVALFPDVDGAAEVTFPDDAELTAQDLDVDGISRELLTEIRRRAVPHPTGVMASPIRLGDERRFEIPLTAVCTSLPSAVLQQLAEAGQLPTELLRYADVEYVDVPTSHWPMFSRPADLAAAIGAAARS